MADSTDRLSFDEFATMFGSGSDELYTKMRTFNESLSGKGKLSNRTLEKMRTDGVSKRNVQTRSWIKQFSDHIRSEHDDLSYEKIEAYLGSFQSRPAAPTLPVQPEFASFIHRVTDAISNNQSLEDEREDYAGFYRIIRRTSKRDETHFHEEPFFLGNHGQESWLIPNAQRLNRGVSFASAGICTTILTHPHNVRVLGVRMIMLYGHDNPGAEMMSGVMLRFSDDQARPAASQIIAKRVTDPNVNKAWLDAIDELRHLEDTDSPRNRIREVDGDLSRYAEIVTQDGERAADHAEYSRLIEQEHTKAFDSDDWKARIDPSISSTDADHGS